VVDVGNGMTGILLKDLLKRLKIDFIPLYFEPDFSFPNHLPDPIKEENLRDLKKEVLKRKAILGAAFDGDGDRIVFVDERGKTVPSWVILGLLAKEVLKKEKKAKILFDLTMSKIIKETIEKEGGKPIMTRVGHSFIKDKMKKTKAILAGELSGHFYFSFSFFKEKAFFESPILTMLKIFEILTKERKNLSFLSKPFKKYFHSGEINFIIKDRKEFLKKIKKIYYKKGKISYLDGFTIKFSDWWFNLRPSNTEPNLIRLNMEAKTKKLLKEKIKEIKKILNKWK
jgi:phosphomannomutase